MENKYDRLVKLVDLMEQHSDDPRFLKELKKEYNAITKELFPKKKSEHGYSAKQIKESRQKAFEKIKEYLDKDNVEEQFSNLSGDYHSKDKFILSYLTNFKGFPYELTIDKVDGFYQDYSGFKCIKARRSLVSETQLKGFHSFERALVEEGLKLAPSRKEFFDKYAVAYNNKIRQRDGE